MNYQIEDVFSPRSFPQNTYISRKLDDEETVDDRLRRALAMKGNLILFPVHLNLAKQCFVIRS